LVTCEWWDATWLNEGFARYFQYFGTRWVETEWELEKIYTVEQVQSAFQMDSLVTTHPMTNEVNSPSQVSAMFDNISYNKGSAVIRMMEHMIGTDHFKAALQDYLRIK
jgi:aminopeptidase N